jgi:hypothetical protein
MILSLPGENWTFLAHLNAMFSWTTLFFPASREPPERRIVRRGTSPFRKCVTYIHRPRRDLEEYIRCSCERISQTRDTLLWDFSAQPVRSFVCCLQQIWSFLGSNPGLITWPESEEAFFRHLGERNPHVEFANLLLLRRWREWRVWGQRETELWRAWCWLSNCLLSNWATRRRISLLAKERDSKVCGRLVDSSTWRWREKICKYLLFFCHIGVLSLDSVLSTWWSSAKLLPRMCFPGRHSFTLCCSAMEQPCSCGHFVICV